MTTTIERLERMQTKPMIHFKPSGGALWHTYNDVASFGPTTRDPVPWRASGAVDTIVASVDVSAAELVQRRFDAENGLMSEVRERVLRQVLAQLRHVLSPAVVGSRKELQDSVNFSAVVGVQQFRENERTFVVLSFEEK